MKYMSGWFAVSNNIQEDPKLMRCSEAARLAFFYGLGYCSRQRTDGRIIKEAVPLICFGLSKTPEAIAAELVRFNLWTDIKPDFVVESYVVNNYLYWQPSREQIEKALASGRDRQKKHREKIAGAVAKKSTGQVVELATARSRRVAKP